MELNGTESILPVSARVDLSFTARDIPRKQSVESLTDSSAALAAEDSMKTDQEIQDHVQQELRWDSRIDAADIGVAVESGVVSLSGTVDSFAERQAAQEAALRVSGVHDVANDIQVKVPGHLVRTDADVAQAVRTALEWRSFIPSDRIQTTVTKGVVTLYGTL